jgi:drug/metabolite transporter (DMT)-like permease
VSGSALALALGAAVLHAFWNLALARERDVESAAGVALLAGVIGFVPVAALTWELDGRAWPYLVVTAGLQLLYFVLLAAAYARAELSFVYPVARGAGPVLVLLAGVLVLGNGASTEQIAGVVLVAFGVLLVRGVRGRVRAGDVLLALAVAACIASYTQIDKHGIRYASPATYQELSMAMATVGYAVLLLRRRERGAVRRALRVAPVLAGFATFAAYTLVLAALERAPAASVAAVRETSVVIATALAAAVLGERVGRLRLAGAAIVVAGVALLAR